MSDRPDWMTEAPPDHRRPDGWRLFWGAVRAAALFLLLGGLLLAVLDGLMYFNVIYTIGFRVGNFRFRGEEYLVFALSVTALVLGTWLEIAHRRRRLFISVDRELRWPGRILSLAAFAIITYMAWHEVDKWFYFVEHTNTSAPLTVALLSPYWLPFVFVGYLAGRRRLETHAVLLFFLAESIALLWVAWYSNWDAIWILQLEFHEFS